MSGLAQIADRRTCNAARLRGKTVDLVLYGLNEAGEPAFAEKLNADQRPQLRELAAERLERCHMVEVWDGPTCVLRLRSRTPKA